MNQVRALLFVGLALVPVLLGAIVGGLAGRPCPTCSADAGRLLIGAGTTAALMLAAGIYFAWRRPWIRAAALAILLWPAAYYSATLAQQVGLWWDRL